jgi:hypothetical protein
MILDWNQIEGAPFPLGVSWVEEERADMSNDSRSLAYCLHGASQGDADLYVMINGSSEPQRFGIHERRQASGGASLILPARVPATSRKETARWWNLRFT